MEQSCNVIIYESDQQLRVCMKTSRLVRHNSLPQPEELGNSAEAPCKPALKQKQYSPECCAS